MQKSPLLLLLGALLLCFSTDLAAQNYGSGKKKKKKPEPRERTRTEQTETDDYFDDSGNLTAKLWYGASGTFQISQFAGNGVLAIGIRPMVGYKITPAFSVGPTVGVSYVSQRTQGIGYNGVQYGAGAFTRYRIIPAIFAHAEYYVDRVPFPVSPFELKPGSTNRLVTQYETFSDFLVGLGYQTGGGSSPLGQSIELLYNTTNPPEGIFPFNIRISINYNF